MSFYLPSSPAYYPKNSLLPASAANGGPKTRVEVLEWEAVSVGWPDLARVAGKACTRKCHATGALDVEGKVPTAEVAGAIQENICEVAMQPLQPLTPAPLEDIDPNIQRLLQAIFASWGT